MTATTDSKSAKVDPAAPGARKLPETVEVGRVLKGHGVRGEVKVDIQSDVEGRFAVGSELILVPKTEGRVKKRRRKVRIESIRPTRGASLILFEGCSTRDEADALRGSRLEIEREKVPPAPEGSWYYFELIGCRCVDENAGELGEVVDLLEDGGGHLLRVRPPKREGEKEKTELLVPMVGVFLREIDTAGGIIRLDLPEGLIETCTSKS